MKLKMTGMCYFGVTAEYHATSDHYCVVVAASFEERDREQYTLLSCNFYDKIRLELNNKIN